MAASVVTLMVGALCIILGISNMRGNISSLHSYHRHRVSEEDRLPFGRIVGLGTVIIGIGVSVFSVLSAVTLYSKSDVFILVGSGIMIASFIVGIALSFYGMIKYNKGIF